MIVPEIVEMDEENMEQARKSSWLNNIFQEHGFSVKQKQDILKILSKKYTDERKSQEDVSI